MSEITENTRVPFGRRPPIGEKGRKLGQCSTSYLQWIVRELWESDFQPFAIVAKRILQTRERQAVQVEQEQSLEEQADELLRRAGRRDLCAGANRRRMQDQGAARRSSVGRLGGLESRAAAE